MSASGPSNDQLKPGSLTAVGGADRPVTTAIGPAGPPALNIGKRAPRHRRTLSVEIRCQPADAVKICRPPDAGAVAGCAMAAGCAQAAGHEPA